MKATARNVRPPARQQAAASFIGLAAVFFGGLQVQHVVPTDRAGTVSHAAFSP